MKPQLKVIYTDLEERKYKNGIDTRKHGNAEQWGGDTHFGLGAYNLCSGVGVRQAAADKCGIPMHRTGLPERLILAAQY